MEWIKRGLIFSTEDHPSKARSEWMATHAQCPVAELIEPDRVRVYFSTRSTVGRTSTTFAELSADDPSRVLYLHDRPILPLGALGTFDDCGVMSACVLTHEGTTYFYYTGWNTSTTVPYRLAIGLATSDDGGRTFRRVSEGPILERTHREPHLCAAPYVAIDDGRWKMWYMSGTGWDKVDGKPEPKYHLKYAESDNGVDWDRRGVVCIDCSATRQAVTRPSVLKTADTYQMWYCHRRIDGYRTGKSASYRIGYAESADGIEWQLRDEDGGLDVSPGGWDAEMTAYPYVYRRGATTTMLYNGNGFGRSGFGYAVLAEETESAE